MTSNTHSASQNQASFSKAIPLMLTVLVWFFAATFETGYVAVLNSGIQHSNQASIALA